MNELEVNELAKLGSYGNKPIVGQIEETHISWIILTRKYAFKIKKPLKLSFLDFSSLSKRKKYCDRELQLNQRFSSVYLDVLSVRINRGRWVIGAGKNKVVDYVVRMKRLISARRMDKVLRKKGVTTENIHALAKVVSEFHSGAAMVSNSFRINEAKASFNDISSIVPVIKRYLLTESVSLINESMAWSNNFLDAHARRIEERIRLGFWRDVHGDLHSGNIFLYKKPILFDCIEFNDGYRRIDLINEIAFFCMDLEAHSEKRLAKLFVDEYQHFLLCIETDDDKRLLTYYKCFRANVRAKVHALSAAQSSDNTDDFKLHLKAVRTYLGLMEGYMNEV